MGRKRSGERVRGPYRERDGWRVRHVQADGTGTDRLLPTEESALRYIDALRSEIRAVAGTVEEAIAEYERYLTDKGNKEKSRKETLRRLRRVFPGELPVNHLTRRKCERIYRALVDEGLSADTHRNYLAESRTFAKWLVAKGWIRENPFDGVEGVGRRNHGKAQLRIDEARAWLRTAARLADDGEDGALAALMTILLGLRTHEIVSRQVRDVDDEGRLLWIPASKTAAGRRTLEVPEALRELLREHVRGVPGERPLFPGGDRRGLHSPDWVTDWVRRICKLAQVPLVTAHGMRGLHSTLAFDAGITSHAVAAALGHESPTTTTTSYADHATVDRAARKRSLTLLEGGAESVRIPSGGDRRK